jgi:hypothetical protein
MECREREWRGGRDGNLWGDGGQLPGNLREDGGLLLEVIFNSICRVGFQLFLAID